MTFDRGRFLTGLISALVGVLIGGSVPALAYGARIEAIQEDVAEIRQDVRELRALQYRGE